MQLHLKSILFVLPIVVLQSCGSSSKKEEAKTETPVEQTIALPDMIKTSGTPNGNRFFEYQGKKLFNGATYHNAQTFSAKGKCIVSKMVDGKELFGVINSKGQTLIDFKYKGLTSGFYAFSGYYMFHDEGMKKGFVDTAGNIVVPAKYEDFGSIISEGTVKARIKYPKWGLISMKDEVIIPFEYQFISAWSDGLIRVKKEMGGTYGYMDHSGKMIIADVYKDATDFQEQIAMVKKGNKYGVINTKGETIINFQFDNFAQLVQVEEDKMSSTGTRESLMGFILKGGYISVEKNNKWGYVDLKGSVIIPFEYDQVWEPERDNRVMVRKGEKRGYFDLNTKKEEFK